MRDKFTQISTDLLEQVAALDAEVEDLRTDKAELVRVVLCRAGGGQAQSRWEVGFFGAELRWTLSIHFF